MKKKNLFVLSLSSLTIAALSAGVAAANTNNVSSANITTQSNNEIADSPLAENVAAKSQFFLEIQDSTGKILETVPLGSATHVGFNPNYYFSDFSDKLNSIGNVLLSSMRSSENNSYTLVGTRVGKLIIKDRTTGSENESYYKVYTPNENFSQQKVTYTLPDINTEEYHYGYANGEAIDHNMLTVTVPNNEATKNTVIYKYSVGTKGLAESIMPQIRKIKIQKGQSINLDMLRTAIDFGNNKDKVSSIEPVSPLASIDTNTLGTYTMTFRADYIDHSFKTFTLNIYVVEKKDIPGNNMAERENSIEIHSPSNADKGNKNHGGNNSGSRKRGGGGNGGGSSRNNKNSGNSLPSYVIRGGKWLNSSGRWSYTNSRKYKNEWAAIENPFADSKKGQRNFDWFRFDENGYMLTGWYKDEKGKYYFLNNVSEGSMGAMFTSWHWIKDESDGKMKCYFFNTVSDGSMGALLQNTKTPDGYSVNEKGEWVVNGVVQIK